MKRKLFAQFLIFAVVMIFLASCAPQEVYSAIDLPEGAESAITYIVTLLFSWLIMQLVTLVPWLAKWLEPYKLEGALALSAFVINWLEGAVPDQFGGVAVAAIMLLLAVVKLVEKFILRNYPGFRAR